MKFSVVVIEPPGYQHSRAFDEVRDALHFGLIRAGHDSVREVNRCAVDRVPIVLGANLVPPGQGLPPSSILFNLEQIVAGSPWLSDAYLALLRKYRIWDYSEGNASALRALGVSDVRVVPLGYVPELSRIAPAAKTIDVLFYGSGNKRREAVLQDLHYRGAKVHSAFGVYGAERDILVAQSRIVINIHFYESRVFEIVRIGYLLANRVFVVTEEGSDRDLEGGFAEGVAIAPYASLAGTCMRYLRDEAGRRAVAQRGFEIFSRRDQAALLAPIVAAL